MYKGLIDRLKNSLGINAVADRVTTLEEAPSGASEVTASVTMPWTDQSAITTTPMALRKNGTVVTASIGRTSGEDSGFTSVGGSVIMMGLIPAAFRPAQSVVVHLTGCATDSGGGTTFLFNAMTINADGDVQLYRNQLGQGNFPADHVITFNGFLGPETVSWIAAS